MKRYGLWLTSSSFGAGGWVHSHFEHRPFIGRLNETLQYKREMEAEWRGKLDPGENYEVREILTFGIWYHSISTSPGWCEEQDPETEEFHIIDNTWDYVHKVLEEFRTRAIEVGRSPDLYEVKIRTYVPSEMTTIPSGEATLSRFDRIRLQVWR